MTSTSIDAARVELLLTELRLPSVKAIWPKLAALSDKEGWSAARFLAALAEHEVADRGRRRMSGTWPRRVWPRARRSPASTSTACRCCPRRK
jgi:DNA replication protein DnaC